MDTPHTFVVDTPAKRARVLGIIGRLPLEGRIWDIAVKPWQPRRSLEANKRLWSLHQLAAEHTGHSTDEMHEFCKRKFLPRGRVKVGAEEVEIAGSSSKLSKKAFAEFMEQVEIFYIAELGVLMGDA